MTADDLFSLAVSVISIVTFILCMLLILLLASAFLGREIKITRKMIISACGIFIVEILFAAFSFLFDEQVQGFIKQSGSLILGEGASGEDIVSIGMLLYSFLTNSFAFIYAFIFYYIAYREKKFLRAVESTVFLYGYYFYLHNIIEATIIYLMGGSDEIIEAVTNLKDPSIYLLIAFVLDLIITSLLLLTVYLRFYRRKRVYIVRVRDRILFIIWIVVFALIPSIPLTTPPDDPLRAELVSIVFGIVLPILACFVPSFVVLAAAEKAHKEKTEYQERYMKAELEYIKQYKRKQTETRAFRHDIINNLSLASMMLKEGRADDAVSYLDELLGEVKSLSPEYVTGDDMLDLIVTMKADRMKELGIKFKCDGVVDGGLMMKPTDICGVFANALDNAIEASIKSKDRYVNFEIKRTNQFFVIKISNSTAGKVDSVEMLSKTGYTTKKDTEHHGFGLRNIEKTVEKYSGIVKIDTDEDEFILTIMFPRENSI